MDLIFRALIIVGVMLLAGLSVKGQKDSTLTVEQLPESVQNELADKYKKYEVKNLEKTEKFGQEVYEVKVQKKSTVYKIRYDLEGQFVSRTKSKSFRFDTNERPKPRQEGNVGPPPMPNL
ncbi:hypothetical protein KFE98_18085 [bacterium SCSIO 12741]|nr:hypothetical protein KFE98_18085 [bacterium SCSIO 12741]